MITLRSNAHTHTLFCDAADSAETMVLSAIEKGFTALGFSGHSYHPDALDYCMSEENTLLYIREVRRLQEKYQDQIRLYLGIEEDYYTQTDLSAYEYRIGSVHHLPNPKTGHLFAIDCEPDFSTYFKTLFHEDGVALAREYYSKVADFFVTRKPDIIGHFNVISKFNRGNRFFDEQDPAYRSIACDALLAAAETGAVTEVNTGAITRGLTDECYPNEYMVRLLIEHNYPLMINSDAHYARLLDAHFNETLSWLAHLGAHSILYLGPTGWEELPLYE